MPVAYANLNFCFAEHHAAARSSIRPRGRELGLKAGDDQKTYVGQVLSVISKIKKKYDHVAELSEDPDKKVTLAVGTITSEPIMKRVLENPDVSFAMTAHYPENYKQILDQAAEKGLTIIPTVSKRPDMKITRPTGQGEIVEVKKNTPGNNELDPAHIAELRDKGIECFKASDFTEIAMERAKKAGNQNFAWTNEAWAGYGGKRPADPRVVRASGRGRSDSRFV